MTTRESGWCPRLLSALLQAVILLIWCLINDLRQIISLQGGGRANTAIFTNNINSIPQHPSLENLKDESTENISTALWLLCIFHSSQRQVVTIFHSDCIHLIMQFIRQSSSAYCMLTMALDPQDTKEECDVVPGFKVSWSSARTETS